MLAVLGINLTGALIGGTVGGIIVGLASQVILSNFISGILISTSKTIKPGDIVLLLSWKWGAFGPILGEVVKVTTLYTELRTINNTKVRISNSDLLSGTIVNKLEGENPIFYPYQVTISADVSAIKVLEKVKKTLETSCFNRKIIRKCLAFIFLVRAETQIFLLL